MILPKTFINLEWVKSLNEPNYSALQRLFSKIRFIESNQYKIRPVIIVGQPYGKRRIVMVIPVSSLLHAESVDVVLENWQDIGLLKPSVARVHRLSAMLADDLCEEIGKISKTHQAAIKTSLHALLKI